MAASTLRSATTVADLSLKVVGRLVVDGGQAVRDLMPQIEAAAARLGAAADGDRVSTARAGVALVEELRRQPERGAEVLAAATVPTSMAALGTSIVQSAEVTSALQEANWDLLRAATELGGAAQADADAIKARLVEALHADELAVGLVGRLRDAASAATQLLARAAKPADQPPDGSSTRHIANRGARHRRPRWWCALDRLIRQGRGGAPPRAGA